MGARSDCERSSIAHDDGMRRFILLAITCLAIACGPSAQARPTVTPRPMGTLHAPHEYAVEFAIDQQVRVEYGTESQSFRAVVEKRGDRIVMIGLGPHGGRAFSLTQEGEVVTFDSQLPRELPFPPEFMLMDLHRTWLKAIPHEGASMPDGEHEAFIDGETIRETWLGGRLQSRAFSIMTSNLAWWGVTVTYEGGLDFTAGAAAPSRVVIECTMRVEDRTAGRPTYRLVLEGISINP
jgi:hypothetical protein